jgi:hypothetical protein
VFPSYFDREVKMNYSLLAILLVFVLACAMMAEAFWSSLHIGKDFTHSFHKSIATGIGFVIYAGINYLMIVPGANYVIS